VVLLLWWRRALAWFGGVWRCLARQPLGQGERHVFFQARHGAHRHGAQLFQAAHDLLYEHFGRRRARGDADALATDEPRGIDGIGAIDQEGIGTYAFGDFAQAVGVGAIGAAHDQHEIALGRQHLDSVLAVLRGVADIAFLGFDNTRKARAQRGRHRSGVVDRQRGLRDESQVAGVGHLQPRDVFDGFDQVHAALRLPQRAFDFGMPLVTDHDDFTPGGAHAGDFDVHFGDQRARGVEHLQPARIGFLAHRLGHAVRREHHDGARRRLIELVDEDGSLGAQIFDHIAVVDDFVAYVDGRPVQLERAFDDIDGAVDAGTEAARLRQDDFGVGRGDRLVHSTTPRMWTSTRSAVPASGWLKSNKAQSGSSCLSTPE